MGSSAASGISDPTMLMTSFIRKEEVKGFLDPSARIGGGVSASQSQNDDDDCCQKRRRGKEPFDGSARVEGGVSAGLESF